MSHLLRDIAPVTDSAWNLLDEEARERLTPGWPPASSSTSRRRRAGRTPRPTSAASSRCRARRSRRSAALGGACCRSSSCVPTSRVARTELQDADRGAADIDLGELADAARRVALAENVAVFHGWADAASPASRRRARTTASTLSGDFDAYAAPRRRGRRGRCSRRGSAARTGSRSGRTATPA